MVSGARTGVHGLEFILLKTNPVPRSGGTHWVTPIVWASPRWYPSLSVMGPSVWWACSADSPVSAEPNSFPAHVLRCDHHCVLLCACVLRYHVLHGPPGLVPLVGGLVAVLGHTGVVVAGPCLLADPSLGLLAVGPALRAEADLRAVGPDLLAAAGPGLPAASFPSPSACRVRGLSQTGSSLRPSPVSTPPSRA
jgi:hypothetical protein